MHTRDSPRPPFANYAISYFSGHLSKASSSDDRHLIALNQFFLTNSLTWIELVVSQHDLGSLTETAKNLKVLMERRAKYRSPLGKEVQNVLEWADDLIRLVAQFGRALLSTPSAIHFLVPSVCPSGSIIFRNFAKYPRPLKLVGLSQTSWNDRLCCIMCAEARVLCIVCDVNKFAIGLNDCSVQVYHSRTFQKIFHFAHGELVRCLAFSRVKGFLAAASRRIVNVWDLRSGLHMWSASLSDQPLAFDFTEDDAALMAGTRDNKMIFWNAANGEELKSIARFSDYDEDEGTPFGHGQPPIHAAFSPGLGLLGVAYRMRPITFWEIESCNFAGQYAKIGAGYHEPFVHAFLFNPVPDICLAAVAFQTGDIVVLDPWSQNTQAMVDCDSSCLAASPNGTILASGDSEGVIKLFDFETLRLLYQINSHEENIRSIAFSTSGLRFYDIRADHCNVWEPSVLVRRVSFGDDSSIDQSDRVADEPHFTTARATGEDQEITAFATHHDGEFIFCGFESGAVKMYSTAHGKHVQHVLEHPGRSAILLLRWNEKADLLTSVDRAGGIIIHQISRKGHGKPPFAVQSKVFELKSPSAVRQLLLDPLGKRMLLVNSQETSLWDLQFGQTICENPNEESHTLLWMVHPQESELLLLIRDGMQIQTYSWKSLELQGQSEILTPEPASSQELRVDWARMSSSSRHICAMLRDSYKKGTRSILCVYPCEVTSAQPGLRPIATYNDLAKNIKAVIGCHKAMLLFLNHEDWVCSLNIDNARQNNTYTKHFYIPQQWQGSRATTTQMLVTKKGHVVLVSMDELAVFHGGLDFEEQVEVSQKGTAASPKLLDRPAFKKGHSSPL
ncbi:WD40 repeat-like protein [Byssothecium circinans]|uniref:WD40 repeat-like protein n=1 Tax=Byssothecium circinans TaxID=147558 RepID=A0A6A5TTM4_9PLEO|nr:WD40 repeat-like protein [Byssothecium circinans]